MRNKSIVKVSSWIILQVFFSTAISPAYALNDSYDIQSHLRAPGILASRDGSNKGLLDDLRNLSHQAGVHDNPKMAREITSHLQITEGTRVLDLGVGASLSVHAARQGGDVVSVNMISDAASSLRQIVQTLQSDLKGNVVVLEVGEVKKDFLPSILNPHGLFRYITAYPPWTDHPVKEAEDYAYYDPGFVIISEILLNAAGYLTDDGELLIGYSTAPLAFERIQQLSDAGNLTLDGIDNLGDEAVFHFVRQKQARDGSSKIGPVLEGVIKRINDVLETSLDQDGIGKGFRAILSEEVLGRKGEFKQEIGLSNIVEKARTTPPVDPDTASVEDALYHRKVLYHDPVLGYEVVAVVYLRNDSYLPLGGEHTPIHDYGDNVWAFCIFKGEGVEYQFEERRRDGEEAELALTSEGTIRTGYIEVVTKKGNLRHVIGNSGKSPYTVEIAIFQKPLTKTGIHLYKPISPTRGSFADLVAQSFLKKGLPIQTEVSLYRPKQSRDTAKDGSGKGAVWGTLLWERKEGTQIRRVVSPEELPESVQGFWHDHDALYILHNPELGFSVYIGAHRFLPFEESVWVIGGSRMVQYDSEETAMKRAFFLSQDMTYKNAMAGLLWDDERKIGVGGGKVVINFDPNSPDKSKVLESVAKALGELNIIFTGQDQNISPDDATLMAQLAPTAIVGSNLARGGIPPTPPTARGVYLGMEAGMEFAFKDSPSLEEKRISLQSAGGVGSHLSDILMRETDSTVVTITDNKPLPIKAITENSGEYIKNGRLVVLGEVTPIQHEALNEDYLKQIFRTHELWVASPDSKLQVKLEFDPEEFAAFKQDTQKYIDRGWSFLLFKNRSDEIYDIPADIFSPSATEWVLTEETISRLEKAGVRYIAGCANDQLKRPEAGERDDLVKYLAQLLHQKRILYAPDYVINAGGLMGVASGLFGYDVNERLKKIPQNLKKIFEISLKNNLPTTTVADLMANELVKDATQKRSFVGIKEWWKVPTDSAKDSGTKVSLANVAEKIAGRIPDEVTDLYQGSESLPEVIVGAIDEKTQKASLNSISKLLAREVLFKKSQGRDPKVSPMPFSEDPYWFGIVHAAHRLRDGSKALVLDGSRLLDPRLTKKDLKDLLERTKGVVFFSEPRDGGVELDIEMRYGTSLYRIIKNRYASEKRNLVSMLGADFLVFLIDYTNPIKSDYKKSDFLSVTKWMESPRKAFFVPLMSKEVDIAKEIRLGLGLLDQSSALKQRGMRQLTPATQLLLADVAKGFRKAEALVATVQKDLEEAEKIVTAVFKGL